MSGARASLEKAMQFFASTRNKAGFYAMGRMSEAVARGRQEKTNKPFWEGLALFHECRFDEALPLFAKAAKTAAGRELVGLLVRDRRLDPAEIHVLGKLAGIDVSYRVRKQRKRIAEIDEFRKRWEE